MAGLGQDGTHSRDLKKQTTTEMVKWHPQPVQIHLSIGKSLVMAETRLRIDSIKIPCFYEKKLTTII